MLSAPAGMILRHVLNSSVCLHMHVVVHAHMLSGVGYDVYRVPWQAIPPVSFIMMLASLHVR